MLIFIIAAVLMLEFSRLPMWVSIPIILLCAFIDYRQDTTKEKIAHLRFMTIDKGLMNIILRISGKGE